MAGYLERRTRAGEGSFRLGERHGFVHQGGTCIAYVSLVKGREEKKWTKGGIGYVAFASGKRNFGCCVS